MIKHIWVFLLFCACAPAVAQDTTIKPLSPVPEGDAEAIFAGGCFWCMQHPFDETPGVISSTVGYTGGRTVNPTYGSVSNGGTGHAEAIRIVYDPKQVKYEQLLQIFWHNVDPVQSDGQFCDIGDQYRSEIFYRDDEQKRLAELSKAEVEKTKRFNGKVVTKIVPAGVFYPAEEYHQRYYEKNPIRYKFYRNGCGRDARLRVLWGEQAGH